MRMFEVRRINRIFTAESVSPGHPDSFMDYVVNSILDEYLKQDPNARVAIDGVVKNKFITLGGEITSVANITNDDIKNIIRKCVTDIGYNFEPEITLNLFKQSPDIALGTNDEVGGAGDQGTITGYACNSNERAIPLEKALADDILRNLFSLRAECDYIKPDMKSQVTLKYDSEGIPIVDTIVIACQHSEDCDYQTLENKVREIINTVLFNYDLSSNYKLVLNGTGKFILGGPEADSGEVGRKIVVDAYGVSVPVGGGTYNGKDPTKVDRSAAYMARYVAKNIVAAELADECLITVSYCIGLSDPISIDFEFFGTEKVPSSLIVDAVLKSISFKPHDIIERLNLQSPIYAVSGLLSHYGCRNKLGLDESYVNVPWEQTDLSEELKEIIHN